MRNVLYSFWGSNTEIVQIKKVIFHPYNSLNIITYGIRGECLYLLLLFLMVGVCADMA